MRTSYLCVGAMLLIAALFSECSAGESFSELVRRVPAHANAVLLIDVDAINRSPHATKEGWAKNHERDSLHGVDSLPPEVERLVIGAQISPTTLDPVWKVGIAAMRTTITPARLAEVEGGSIDALGGRPVVLSPRNAYYALLTPQTVGAMHPANRQEFSRWLRANGELSAYLRDATANATAPVLLALDLTDVFDPAGVRAKLAKSKALANHLTDLDRIAHAVASLKGVRLAVQVGPTIQAELRLDCDAPTALAPVAKALVLEALDASGSAVEDLETWTARASGPAVILSGTLTERGLRQLVSPLLSPAVVATSTGSSPAAAGDSGKPNAAASQRYFRSVNKLLKDLRAQKFQNYNNLSRAYEMNSKQIDELPLLGVDPELLTYGMQVSVTLRNLGVLGKATNAQQRMIAMQQATVPVDVASSQGYGNPYYGYGYAPTTTTVNVSNAGQINSLIAQGGATEQVTRAQTWNNIDKASADIRQKMTAKYRVEF